MTKPTDIVLILGSGPNAPVAKDWPRHWFDRVVAINNAWRVRADWDDLVFPEDFPVERRPSQCAADQRFVQADQFVPAQNAYGGFVYAGGTMAYTAAYWALHALRPKVLAFMGCDMVYPKSGATHFYGTGAADPLRADVTLRDLGAKSARLGLLAARQGCACVNLSKGQSQLVFTRACASELRRIEPVSQTRLLQDILDREEALGLYVPSGRYWEQMERFDAEALAQIDQFWRELWEKNLPVNQAA